MHSTFGGENVQDTGAGRRFPIGYMDIPLRMRAMTPYMMPDRGDLKGPPFIPGSPYQPVYSSDSQYPTFTRGDIQHPQVDNSNTQQQPVASSDIPHQPVEHGDSVEQNVFHEALDNYRSAPFGNTRGNMDEYAECELGTYRPNDHDTSYYDECVQSGQNMQFWLRRQCPPGTAAKQFPTAQLPCDFEGTAYHEPPEGAQVQRSGTEQVGVYQDGYHHEGPGAVFSGESSARNTIKTEHESWTYNNSPGSDLSGEHIDIDDQLENDRFPDIPVTPDPVFEQTLIPKVALYVTQPEDVVIPTLIPTLRTKMITHKRVTTEPSTTSTVTAPSTTMMQTTSQLKATQETTISQRKATPNQATQEHTTSQLKATQEATTSQPKATQKSIISSLAPPITTVPTVHTSTTSKPRMITYRTTPYNYHAHVLQEDAGIMEAVESADNVPIDDVQATHDNTTESPAAEQEHVEERQQFLAEAQGDLAGAKNVDFNSVSMISRADIASRTEDQNSGPFQLPFVFDMDDVMLWPGDVLADGDRSSEKKHGPMYHLKIPIPEFYENIQR